jgi:hypothetical protein
MSDRFVRATQSVDGYRCFAGTITMIPQGQFQFYRGPYDGLILDAEGVRRYCHTRQARKDGNIRYFLLLPPLTAWDAVIAGWTDYETFFKNVHTYELATATGVAKLNYCAPRAC